MDNLRNTEERETNKNYVHCPHCDKKWFTVVSAVDLNYKCDKCHRRYLINIDEDEVSIKRINKQEEDVELFLCSRSTMENGGDG